MTLLQAGELDKRIMFLAPVTRRGPSGEQLPDGTEEKGPAWAKMKLVSGRKIRTLDQAQVIQTWQFTLPPRPDIQPGWQIQLGGMRYTIRDIDSSQPDQLVITAEVDPRHDRTGN